MFTMGGKEAIYNLKVIVWHLALRGRLAVKCFEEGAFKSGAERSFSKYRYYNSGKLNLFQLMVRLAAFGAYCIIDSVMAKSFVFLKDRNYYRYEASPSYYKARFLYEVRLAFDNDSKNFVKRKNWLE